MLAKGVFSERKDFRKVPTRKVFDLWVIYNGLPRGSVRKDYRRRHPALEDWLIDAKDYSPVDGPIEDPEALDKWEELARKAAKIFD